MECNIGWTCGLGCQHQVIITLREVIYTIFALFRKAKREMCLLALRRGSRNLLKFREFSSFFSHGYIYIYIYIYICMPF